MLRLSQPRCNSYLVVALLFKRAWYWCLENSLKRRRPQDYIADLSGLDCAGDQFSFPSGHTSAAFLLATCTAFVYQELAVTLYLWASCAGWSELILGVHYPDDTLAGAAMGSGIALLIGGATGI